MNNLKTKNNYLRPQEEFLRQVIFLKDDNKILAVFPFYHEISDTEYKILINLFFEKNEKKFPSKKQFCLIYEETFGWGWIHKNIVSQLEVAQEHEYKEFRDRLLSKNIIKKSFILNIS